MIARLLLALALGATLSAAQAETIGLRFIVDTALGSTAGQQQTTAKRLAGHVAELNGYFRNSEVGLAAEIVDIEFSRLESAEVMSILGDMENERRGFPDLFRRAAEYGADYTVAVVGHLLIRGKRGCGRAYAVNQTVAEISSTRRAFAAVDIACGAHTLAHELGHLMGLNHGALVDTCAPEQGHTSAIAPYANGYGQGPCDGRPAAGKFGTVMVGGWMKAINGDGHSSLPLFSNPRIRDARCGEHGICGDALTGDAARALNENARYYAGHEEPDVHTLRYASPELAECIGSKYRERKVAELDELVCPKAGIATLAGIERLTALKRIDLAGNLLGDADALLALNGKAIEKIDLADNPRLSCTAIDRLVQAYGRRLEASTSCTRPPLDE
ncbi:MAG: zinc-dependent metalloprotease family protein [Sulfurisoma sp.]|nr:zinc-dependent metalloprotease family protein [Sulfurisoma sp.]